MNIRIFGIFTAIVSCAFSNAFAADIDNGADRPPAFINLKDGDTVPNPVIVKVGPPIIGKNTNGAAGAHTHLIVDSPLPSAGQTIPMDARHVHLMNGATQTVLHLSAGDHTLQLVVGGANHQIVMPILASQMITIHVAPQATPAKP